jgi:hypothetical protein
MARAVHRLAAQEHDAGCFQRRDGDLVAWTEDEKLPLLEGIARDVDLALSDIYSTLLVFGRQGNAGARFQCRVGVEGRGRGFDRRGLAVERTGDDSDRLAFRLDDRQRAGGVVDEGRCCFFGLRGLRRPKPGCRTG